MRGEKRKKKKLTFSCNLVTSAAEYDAIESYYAFSLFNGTNWRKSFSL